jgi:hypothetical protein
MPGDAIWLSQMSASGGTAWPRGLAIDQVGDIVAVGYFGTSAKIGNTTLTSAGGTDIFVAKLSGKTGDLIWAKQLGGTDDDQASDVAIDSTNAIYVTGQYSSPSIDLGGGPLPGTSNRETTGFVVKLGADGTHVWSHNFPVSGGDSESAALSISAGAKGIAVSGQFSGTATINGAQFVSAGKADIFVAKLGIDGSPVWAKSFGGTGYDFGYDVAIDNVGDVVCAGAFQGVVNFGGGSKDAGSSSAALLLKLASADGSHLFSERLGSMTAESDAYAVAVDSSNSIFLTGGFWGSGDFGNGVPLNSSFAMDPFVAKYSASGAYLWAKSFSSTGHSSESATSAAVDSSGDVAVTGSFCGNLSLGDKQNLTAASLCPTGTESTDMFVARLSGVDGTPLAYSSGGGVLTDSGNAVALAPDGRIFVTGPFQGFAEFGGSTVTASASASNGAYDAFIVSLPAL